MKIVLFQPEIPQNAGNIVRTCAVTGNSLTLVRPLGFSVSAKALARAGLDYWEGVDVTIEDALDESLLANRPFYFFSSKASSLYTEISYSENDILIFGSETKGLPSFLWERWGDHFYKIPMMSGKRCLNLSNSVAIVIYEAWRQRSFKERH